MNRMRVLPALPLVLIVFALTFLGTPATVSAQNPNPTGSCVFVREAGHNIHGAFFLFYQTYGGATRFGVPLTEAFMEDDKLVQYFTYARFELMPQNPEAYRVQLGLLGIQYYNVTDPPVKSVAIPSLNDPNFRYFPETGLMIGFAIKEYYAVNGGIDMFGYPVSQLRYENGAFVQYFQRARLEWNPVETSSAKVRLAPVGQLALDRRYAADFVWRQRTTNDWCQEGNVPLQPRRPTVTRTPQPPPAGLRLDVHLHFAQTGTKGPQYVVVTVDDRVSGKPVPGVALYAVIQSTRGTRVIPLMATDEDGKSFFSFDIGVQPAGSTTVVTVHAYLGSVTTKSSVSFQHQ